MKRFILLLATILLAFSFIACDINIDKHFPTDEIVRNAIENSALEGWAVSSDDVSSPEAVLEYARQYPELDELLSRDDLSELIDEARSTNDKTIRSELYMEAMEQILELAIELPVYQRSVLYSYNSKVISSKSVSSEINPFSSPLDRIWEIEFAG